MMGLVFSCFRVTALVAALVFGSMQSAWAFDHAEVARQAMSRHIIPAYQAFADEAHELTAKSSAYCSGEPGGTLADFRSTFRDTLVAWGRIAHVRFGPVASDNRYERILFWPDPRHVTAKQVGTLLRKKPADALQPGFFASASVAVSGLRSLELVLFGRGSERLEALDSDASRYRCGLAHALAGALNQTSAGVLAEWSEAGAYRELWLNPGTGNPRFLKPSETTQALVQSFTDRLDRLLGFDIPASSEDGKTTEAEPLFAESGSSVAYLTASLEGLEELLRAGGFIDQAAKDGAENEDIQQRLNAVMTELDFARRALGIMAKSADEQGGFTNVPAAQWNAVRLPLQNARHLADETLKVQAGLSSGFNALDGD
jgi:predicted lipoprotein